MKKNLALLSLLVVTVQLFAQQPLMTGNEPAPFPDTVHRTGNIFKPLKYAVFGDSIKNYSGRSVIYIHPPYENIFFNNVEGFGLDAKVDYLKQFDKGKVLKLTPEVRYGFSNSLLSVNTGFAYKFDAFNKGFFYGKVGSNVLDLNNEIFNSMFLNSLSILFFDSNAMKFYRTTYGQLGIQRNVANGLLLDGSLELAKRRQLYNTTYYVIRNVKDPDLTSNNPLSPNLPDNVTLFPETNALTLRLSATITFDEQYTEAPTGRIYKESKYPQIKLSYRKGINGPFNSDVDYDYADIQVYQNNIKIGGIGYSSFMVSAGNFFNTRSLFYPDYKKFQGNEGITFNPLVSYFHFLPYYVYTTNSFFEAHYQHNFSGLLMNRLPLLRSFKLEEIIGANYLSRENNTGYTEVFFGLKRGIYRIDYGAGYQGGHLFKQGIMLYYGF